MAALLPSRMRRASRSTTLICTSINVSPGSSGYCTRDTLPMSTPPMRTVEPGLTPCTSSKWAWNTTLLSNRLRLSPIRKMIPPAPNRPASTKVPTLISREIAILSET
jgi:hypothetical protein